MAKEFIPSAYQQAIFDFIDNESGDLRVNAVAGSGKTTVLVGAAKRLPLAIRFDSIFVAFNKHIAEELASRLPQGVQASTLHSIGFKVILTALKLPPYIKVEGNKMDKIVRGYCADTRPESGLEVDEDDKDALVKMARFAMMTMTDTRDEEAVLLMCQHFSIDVDQWEYCFAALTTIVETGVKLAVDGVAVSFDDMIYLPVAMGLTLPKYSFLFCDEVQDFNNCQRQFVLGMRKPGGRAIWVGDAQQAIYGFAGANSESFERIVTDTGASQLPLSVCYRCPKSHVKLAQAIVPHIEAFENAPEGVTGDVKRSQIVSFSKTGDLILCRVTAPLVELCFELIAGGKSAKVKGRDIGAGLIKILDTISKVRGFAFGDFKRHLDEYHERMLKALLSKEGSEMKVESLNDRVDTIWAIYTEKIGQGRLSSIADFRREIEAIFSDTFSPIVLSTVHKAKGMENERVLILKEEKMPHPMAKQAWQIVQEMNIRYIALTRSQAELYFIRDDD